MAKAIEDPIKIYQVVEDACSDHLVVKHMIDGGLNWDSLLDEFEMSYGQQLPLNIDRQFVKTCFIKLSEHKRGPGTRQPTGPRLSNGSGTFQSQATSSSSPFPPMVIHQQNFLTTPMIKGPSTDLSSPFPGEHILREQTTHTEIDASDDQPLLLPATNPVASDRQGIESIGNGAAQSVWEEVGEKKALIWSFKTRNYEPFLYYEGIISESWVSERTLIDLGLEMDPQTKEISKEYGDMILHSQGTAIITWFPEHSEGFTSKFYVARERNVPDLIAGLDVLNLIEARRESSKLQTEAVLPPRSHRDTPSPSPSIVIVDKPEPSNRHLLGPEDHSGHLNEDSVPVLARSDRLEETSNDNRRHPSTIMNRTGVPSNPATEVDQKAAKRANQTEYQEKLSSVGPTSRCYLWLATNLIWPIKAPNVGSAWLFGALTVVSLLLIVDSAVGITSLSRTTKSSRFLLRPACNAAGISQDACLEWLGFSLLLQLAAATWMGCNFARIFRKVLAQNPLDALERGKCPSIDHYCRPS